MEKVQKLVQDVSEFGQPDQYGNKNFWVTLEGNEQGLFRTKDNNLFVVGQVAEYSIKEYREGKNGKYPVFQRYKEDFQPGKKFEKSSKNSEKFMCMSYAKDIFIAFNGKMPSPTEVTAYAEALYSETLNGGEHTKPDGHAQALQSQQVEENKLPF